MLYCRHEYKSGQTHSHEVSMLVCSVVGARPQFVKAAVVSKALQNEGIREKLIHTGQHYDYELSGIFFKHLGLRRPALNLGVGSGTHAYQTAEILKKLEPVLRAQKPHGVLVYGDTNSTLAGALAAAKLDLPVFHVEAGLRSYNRSMPEEINRVVTDHLSSLLFAPTRQAVINLAREGIRKNVSRTGDVMQDSLERFLPAAEKQSKILPQLKISPKKYQLLTLHRPQNVDDQKKLKNILQRIVQAGVPTVFPVHPRTEKKIGPSFEKMKEVIHFTGPVGYEDMLVLEKNACRILTDSGGVQKEAYLLKIPCITLRTETEWIETTRLGWNRVTGGSLSRLEILLGKTKRPRQWTAHYGNGHASEKIAKMIHQWLKKSDK